VKYAIRLPANDNLRRNIVELLTGPVGRPSYKPIVRYESFLYQAASWKAARRVVAKVQFHFGELFPRVGFIVTDGEDRWPLDQARPLLLVASRAEPSDAPALCKPAAEDRCAAIARGIGDPPRRSGFR